MEKIKIALIGDVMCGDSYFAIGRGTASAIESFGADFVDGSVRRLLSGHDVVMCNLECVLSDIGRNERSVRRLHMRGRPRTARYLASWGINVANLANNHILEQGMLAAADTMANLENAGIRTVGAGKDGTFTGGLQAAEMNFGRQKLAVLGFSLCKEKYSYDGGAVVDEVISAVKSRAKDGTAVVVSVHWGDEWMDRPNREQRQIGRALADAGAAVVFGHHPHVVQGVEYSNERLIAYSLGNFIFNTVQVDTRWSMILSLEIESNRVVRWRYIPIEIDSDYRPHIAGGKTATLLTNEIERRCSLVDGKQSHCRKRDDGYKLEKKLHGTEARRRLRLAVLGGFWQVNPVYWPQLLWRPVQRRLGIW